MKKLRLAAAIPVAVAATLAIDQVYRRILREPILNWGATADERRASLPGDELLENAAIVATRAITIDAPASAVWPWLVQMGPGRAGAYTYDWIERLAGLDMHSAGTIIPEFQNVVVGDVVPMTPNGPGMRVEILKPERLFSTRSEDGRWVWTFALSETGGRTRLVSRNRIASQSSLGDRLGMLVMEPGSLVMERKMLLGIKQRAERSVDGSSD